jgi:hypothetical protein
MEYTIFVLITGFIQIIFCIIQSSGSATTRQNTVTKDSPANK